MDQREPYLFILENGHPYPELQALETQISTRDPHLKVRRITQLTSIEPARLHDQTMVLVLTKMLSVSRQFHSNLVQLQQNQVRVLMYPSGVTSDGRFEVAQTTADVVDGIQRWRRPTNPVHSSSLSNTRSLQEFGRGSRVLETTVLIYNSKNKYFNTQMNTLSIKYRGLRSVEFTGIQDLNAARRLPDLRVILIVCDWEARELDSLIKILKNESNRTSTILFTTSSNVPQNILGLYDFSTSQVQDVQYIIDSSIGKAGGSSYNGSSVLSSYNTQKIGRQSLMGGQLSSAAYPRGPQPQPILQTFHKKVVTQQLQPELTPPPNITAIPIPVNRPPFHNDQNPSFGNQNFQNYINSLQQNTQIDYQGLDQRQEFPRSQIQNMTFAPTSSGPPSRGISPTSGRIQMVSTKKLPNNPNIGTPQQTDFLIVANRSEGYQQFCSSLPPSSRSIQQLPKEFVFQTPTVILVPYQFRNQLYQVPHNTQNVRFVMYSPQLIPDAIVTHPLVELTTGNYREMQAYLQRKNIQVSNRPQGFNNAQNGIQSGMQMGMVNGIQGQLPTANRNGLPPLDNLPMGRINSNVGANSVEMVWVTTPNGPGDFHTYLEKQAPTHVFGNRQQYSNQTVVPMANNPASIRPILKGASGHFQGSQSNIFRPIVSTVNPLDELSRLIMAGRVSGLSASPMMVAPTMDHQSILMNSQVNNQLGQDSQLEQIIISPRRQQSIGGQNYQAPNSLLLNSTNMGTNQRSVTPPVRAGVIPAPAIHSRQTQHNLQMTQTHLAGFNNNFVNRQISPGHSNWSPQQPPNLFLNPNNPQINSPPQNYSNHNNMEVTHNLPSFNRGLSQIPVPVPQPNMPPGVHAPVGATQIMEWHALRSPNESDFKILPPEMFHRQRSVSRPNILGMSPSLEASSMTNHAMLSAEQRAMRESRETSVNQLNHIENNFESDNFLMNQHQGPPNHNLQQPPLFHHHQQPPQASAFVSHQSRGLPANISNDFDPQDIGAMVYNNNISQPNNPNPMVQSRPYFDVGDDYNNIQSIHPNGFIPNQPVQQIGSLVVKKKRVVTMDQGTMSESEYYLTSPRRAASPLKASKLMDMEIHLSPTRTQQVLPQLQRRFQNTPLYQNTHAHESLQSASSAQLNINWVASSGGIVANQYGIPNVIPPLDAPRFDSPVATRDIMTRASQEPVHQRLPVTLTEDRRTSNPIRSIQSRTLNNMNFDVRVENGITVYSRKSKVNIIDNDYPKSPVSVRTTRKQFDSPLPQHLRDASHNIPTRQKQDVIVDLGYAKGPARELRSLSHQTTPKLGYGGAPNFRSVTPQSSGPIQLIFKKANQVFEQTSRNFQDPNFSVRSYYLPSQLDNVINSMSPNYPTILVTDEVPEQLVRFQSFSRFECILLPQGKQYRAQQARYPQFKWLKENSPDFITQKIGSCIQQLLQTPLRTPPQLARPTQNYRSNPQQLQPNQPLVDIIYPYDDVEIEDSICRRLKNKTNQIKYYDRESLLKAVQQSLNGGFVVVGPPFDRDVEQITRLSPRVKVFVYRGNPNLVRQGDRVKVVNTPLEIIQQLQRNTLMM